VKQNLCLATLGELNSGAAGVVIDSALRGLVADLDDRGDDGKERKTIITIGAKKLDNGQVAIAVEAKTKVPAYRTPATIGNLKHVKGELFVQFQSEDPEDPDQMTLDEYRNQEEAS
jgi:hypothetical protein